ncbi:MAG: DUF370 domain-containing protein [Clostridia bacterium]
MKLVNIGFGNMVSEDKIVSIISPESAPAKRMITEARDDGVLIDATHGRKTRSVIITDSSHIILSANTTKSIAIKVDANIDEGEPNE